MNRDRAILAVCGLAFAGLAIFLGFRAWGNRIQTFQGVVSTDILYIPENAGTGILLQTAAGRIELEWDPRARHRQMAETLNGKNIRVRGYFRDYATMTGQRTCFRVIEFAVIPDVSVERTSVSARRGALREIDGDNLLVVANERRAVGIGRIAPDDLSAEGRRRWFKHVHAALRVVPRAI